MKTSIRVGFLLTLLLPGPAGADTARNWLFNSSFWFNQRFDATSGSTTRHFVKGGGYTLDRWYATRFGAAGFTLTRYPTSTGTPYNIRIQREVGDTRPDGLALCQPLPYDVARNLAGQTVTLSFWAARGADWSSRDPLDGIQTRIITGRSATGIGTEGTVATLLSEDWARLAHDTSIHALSGTRTRYSHTARLDAGATEAAVCFRAPTFADGPAGPHDYITIDSPKLEIGRRATPYEPDDMYTEWRRVGAFYEDFGRNPWTGRPTFLVSAVLFANTTGVGVQWWRGALQFQVPKRHNWYTVSMGTGAVGSTSSHITVFGGPAIFDLVFDACDHKSLWNCFLNIYWKIDAGHPSIPNGTPAALALDGGNLPENQGRNSFLIIDAEMK